MAAVEVELDGLIHQLKSTTVLRYNFLRAHVGTAQTKKCRLAAGLKYLELEMAGEPSVASGFSSPSHEEDYGDSLLPVAFQKDLKSS